MADDYAKATAAPGFIQIGEAQYRVGKISPRDKGDLESYIKSQSPDPRLMAKELCAGLTDAVAIEVWRDLSMEAANWPPGLESRIGNKVIMETWEGNAQLLWVVLRRHNGNFTIEDARRLTKIDDEVAARALMLSIPENTFDPKSQPVTIPGQD